MSDVATLNEQPKPGRPTTTIERAGLTPRVRSACDAMVWDGLPFDDAAVKSGLTVRAMRLALAKPAVVQYLKQQQQVLRGSEGPRSIHRIREIRDAAENKPALDAALWFVTEDAQQQRGSGQQSPPGVTIRIVNVMQAEHASAPRPVTIDANPVPTLPDSRSEATGGENR
jgi:hypothetical protein